MLLGSVLAQVYHLCPYHAAHANLAGNAADISNAPPLPVPGSSEF